MIKHLTKHGNSYALIIDRGIMNLLHIREDTPLYVATDGKSLTVSPVHDDLSEKEFRKILGKINLRYGPALKHLADA